MNHRITNAGMRSSNGVRWHSDGIAIVDAQGMFIANALNDEQARKAAWEHNDEIDYIKHMDERTTLCEPVKR